MTEVRTLVVTQKAPDQDLVSLEDARIELGFPCTDDAKMKRWITQASAAIASYTKRVWRQETVTETWHSIWFGLYYGDWNTPRPLVLSRYPVSNVAAVSEGDTDLTDAQWLLNGDNGLLYRLNGDCSDQPVVNPLTSSNPDALLMSWWAGNTTSVSYTAGYATTDDVPADVQQACITLLRHRSTSARRDPALRSIDIPGVQAETYWIGAVGDNGALPPEVTGLLIGHIDMRWS
jgi:hypothetical protein